MGNRIQLTESFITTLKELQKEYGCHSKDLSKKLGKNISYISHIIRGKINSISEDTLKNMAIIFSNNAIQNTPNIEQDQIIEDIYQKLKLATIPYMKTFYESSVIKPPRYMNIPDFWSEFKRELMDLGYCFSSFITDVVNKKKEIEITYKHTSDTQLFHLNYDSKFLNELESMQAKASYNDLYAILYCFFELSNSSNPKKETLDCLNDLYFTFSEESERIINDPALLNMITSQDKILATYADHEQQILNYLTTIGAAATELISSADRDKQLSFAKTFASNLLFSDTEFVLGIFENDYTKIVNRSKRKEFILRLKELLQKYSE